MEFEDMKELLGRIKPALSPGHLLISLAAGLSISFFKEQLGQPLKIIRLMPNIPCMVGEGMIVVCRSAAVSIDEVQKIAALLNRVLHKELHTTVLLETMAGKGTEVGRSFEEIAAIIEQVHCSDQLGVCLDTCHIWDGGYDIVNDLDGVLTSFDKSIGLSRLKAIHLNDSLNPLGSHKDRHARIGEGCIGLDALTRVINHPALAHLPFILETPNDHDGYAREIALLRSRYTAE